jgi:hypothetical protein
VARTILPSSVSEERVLRRPVHQNLVFAVEHVRGIRRHLADQEEIRAAVNQRENLPR